MTWTCSCWTLLPKRTGDAPGSAAALWWTWWAPTAGFASCASASPTGSPRSTDARAMRAGLRGRRFERQRAESSSRISRTGSGNCCRTSCGRRLRTRKPKELRKRNESETVCARNPARAIRGKSECTTNERCSAAIAAATASVAMSLSRSVRKQYAGSLRPSQPNDRFTPMRAQRRRRRRRCCSSCRRHRGLITGARRAVV